MNKLLLLFFFTLFLSGNCHAQHKYKRKGNLILGTSITYRFEDEEGVSTRIINQDLTWNLNLAYMLDEQKRIGVSSLQIFGRNEQEPWDNYYLFGAFFQHDFLKFKEYAASASAGFFYGNYAPVNARNTKMNNSIYFDLGLLLKRG